MIISEKTWAILFVAMGVFNIYWFIFQNGNYFHIPSIILCAIMAIWLWRK